MAIFYGISTAITPSRKKNYLHLMTSVVAGSNKTNITLIPEKSWDLDLSINSSPTQFKEALKKILKTIDEVAKLQRRSSKKIKLPFIIGRIDGIDPKHIIEKYRARLEVFCNQAKKPIKFITRRILNTPCPTSLQKFQEKALQIKEDLARIKLSAERGDQLALKILREKAETFGKKWANGIKEKKYDPKFILVTHPLSTIFDWLNLREVFTEAFKKAIGIKGNIIVKKPDDLKDRYFISTAKAIIQDEMDRHPALTETAC